MLKYLANKKLKKKEEEEEERMNRKRVTKIMKKKKKKPSILFDAPKSASLQSPFVSTRMLAPLISTKIHQIKKGKK